MNNYKCKCGNEKDFFTEHNFSQCGLYCGECGKWQKWLNKDEERLFKHKQDLADHDKQIRDEVIDEFVNAISNSDKGHWRATMYEHGEVVSETMSYDIGTIKVIAKQMKGEQND